MTPLGSLAFGGDYNPEQWPAHVLDDDTQLMGQAGVDLVTIGVFSWALLETAPGEFDFDWLDDVFARLAVAGVGVDLATATASPPAWLTTAHPEMLPVTEDGTTLWPGSRQAFCPSSPVYREHALRLCRALAERYADHPSLKLWHVSNELGCHNALCYCDVSAAAFRTWLQERYGDLDGLNRAWGTAFWSQHYTSFEQILPPRAAPAHRNPTQQLDFHRFSSDELLKNFILERDILREVSPGIPVTTNFMVMENFRGGDYWAWAKEVDVISNDHYPRAHDPEAYRELAFCADLTRGLAGQRPWMLMETSTSAVNWQPRNVAKRPGELLVASLQHVSRGADAVLFFQWRASRAGAEKFHAALVPHAGTDTRVWREVVELGGALDAIEEVVGSTSDNKVAIIFDWHAWWACELDAHPSVDVRYLDRAHALHGALLDQGVGVDFVPPDGSLDGYSLVLVPTLYAVSDSAAANIAAAAEAGATVLVTYFSGIVDPDDHIRLGGYPGAFAEMLGIWVEEFLPLREGETVSLSDGHRADVWTEHLHVNGAEEVVTYLDGPAAGLAAVTRNSHGAGAAWYCATRLDRAGIDALVARLVDEAGVEPVAQTGPGVEVVRRIAGASSWVFAINHTAEPAELALRGHELITGSEIDGVLRLEPAAAAVVRES